MCQGCAWALQGRGTKALRAECRRSRIGGKEAHCHRVQPRGPLPVFWLPVCAGVSVWWGEGSVLSPFVPCEGINKGSREGIPNTEKSSSSLSALVRATASVQCSAVSLRERKVGRGKHMASDWAGVATKMPRAIGKAGTCMHACRSCSHEKRMRRNRTNNCV